MRYELTDFERAAIRPFLANKPRGIPRAQLDRTVLQRRVATRYDKLAANYLAFIELASIRIWLRANQSAP